MDFTLSTHPAGSDAFPSKRSWPTSDIKGSKGSLSLLCPKDLIAISASFQRAQKMFFICHVGESRGIFSLQGTKSPLSGDKSARVAGPEQGVVLSPFKG